MLKQYENQFELKKEVEQYTKSRRKTLKKLLIRLVRLGQLQKSDLSFVIDLGSYEGSSSKALEDIGAKRIISVDQNLRALEVGFQSGYIQKYVHEDILTYTTENFPDGYEGSVTAFNCILYLPEESILQLIRNFETKFAKGSKFIFSFSKSQNKWVERFAQIFNNSNWLVEHFTQLTEGELDYNCFIITKK